MGTGRPALAGRATQRRRDGTCDGVPTDLDHRPGAAVALAAGVSISAAAGGGGGSASGTQAADLRPICNNLGFNLPTSAGQSVTIPTHSVAADPDVTPVKLISVFGGSNLGTVAISVNDLVFTRTNPSPGSVTLYWTISDGTLTARAKRPHPTSPHRTTANKRRTNSTSHRNRGDRPAHLEGG
jgi:hypothetical protein